MIDNDDELQEAYERVVGLIEAIRIALNQKQEEINAFDLEDLEDCEISLSIALDNVRN